MRINILNLRMVIPSKLGCGDRLYVALRLVNVLPHTYHEAATITTRLLLPFSGLHSKE